MARSNADLEQFAYSASHDLQEPLRNMSIYSEWLKRRYRGKLDDEAEQIIEILHEGAQRMITMVRDLLAYTEVAKGSDAVHEDADANAVLAKSIRSLHAIIRDSGAIVKQDAAAACGDGRDPLAPNFSKSTLKCNQVPER